MGPLNLKLILQAVDRASGPTSKVSGSLGGLLGRVSALSNRMTRLSAVGGALAAGAAIAGTMLVARSAWSMVKTAADAGDAAWNNAQKIGLTVGAYQRLTYASKLGGVGSEEFASGLGLLSANLYSAARGGKEDLATFKAVGISVRGMKGEIKPAEQVITELADRFAAMPDGAEKTALAMRVFGRSGKQMIPFLNEGGDAIRRMGDEAERLGVVLTVDQAKAADEFNDNMDRMKASVFGLKMGIGNALLPTLNKGMVGVTAWIAAHRPEVIAKVGVLVDRLTTSLAGVDWVKFGDGVINVIVGVTKLFEWIGGLSGIITGAGLFAIGGMTTGVLGLATALGVASGPIGWTILAIGALGALAFTLWRNWDSITQKLGGMFTRWVVAFVKGAKDIWNAIPPWLQGILKGAAFVVKFAAGGAASAVTGAAQASGVRQQPATPGAAAGGRVQVGIKVDQDGRVRQVTAREGSGVLASMVRGQAQAAF